jgi:hypothetical protein
MVSSTTASLEARKYKLGLLISPNPRQTMTTFIVGPKIFVRKLHLPLPVLHAWIHAYSSKIGVFARKLLHLFPPAKRRSNLSLCLTEYFTETWRTIYVKSKKESSAIALGWNPTSINDRSGIWTLIDMPESNSFVSGGLSSYNVPNIQAKSDFRMGRNGRLGVMGLWSTFRQS